MIYSRLLHDLYICSNAEIRNYLIEHAVLYNVPLVTSDLNVDNNPRMIYLLCLLGAIPLNLEPLDITRINEFITKYDTLGVATIFKERIALRLPDLIIPAPQSKGETPVTEQQTAKPAADDFDDLF